MSDADQGAITREIDGAFFRAANYGYSTALSDFIRNTPVQMDRSSIAGRALVEGRIVQISDVKADADYTFFARAGKWVSFARRLAFQCCGMAYQLAPFR